MNVEELRNYCLSLSDEVVEKFPFQKFKGAEDVLAFYINGHIFCFFDINNLTRVTVKNTREGIPALLEQYDSLHKPYNGNAKYWIGIDATQAERALIEQLIATSFHLIQQIR